MNPEILNTTSTVFLAACRKRKGGWLAYDAASALKRGVFVTLCVDCVADALRMELLPHLLLLHGQLLRLIR